MLNWVFKCHVINRIRLKVGIWEFLMCFFGIICTNVGSICPLNFKKYASLIFFIISPYIGCFYFFLF